MTRLIIDSDDPAVLVLPEHAGMLVATYADLLTPSLIAQLSPFLVVIDRGLGDPFGLATVADIEPGADSVANGAAKVRKWAQEGRPYPTAYHDRAIWGEVTTALAGVTYWSWVATLDGTLLPDGRRTDVVQFADDKVTGFHADLSIVWNDHWHPTPAPMQAVQLAALRDQANQAEAYIRSIADTLARL